MTVAALAASQAILGDGTTRLFAVGFPVTDPSTVFAETADGASVAGAMIMGSGFNFTVAPALNQALTIYRRTSISQLRSFPNDASVLPAAIAAAFDKATLIAQEIGDRWARSMARKADLVGFPAKVPFSQLPAGLPSVLPAFLAAFLGAQERDYQDKLRERVSILDFDKLAGTAGHDCSPGFATAFSQLLGGRFELTGPPPPSGAYYVGPNGGDANGAWCMNNPGVPMKGLGRLGFLIRPLSTVGSTCDLIRISAAATNSGYVDALSFDNVTPYMHDGSAYRGRSAVLWDLTVETHAAKPRFSNCYLLGSGAAPSLKSIIDYGVNPSGAILGWTLEDCQFYGGVDLAGVADNLAFIRPIIREQTDIPALKISASHNGDGSAGGLYINNPNIGSGAGGAILIRAGHIIEINNANIEQPWGSSTSVIDIGGWDAADALVSITNLGVGVFGTGACTNILSGEHCSLLSVANYRFLHEGASVQRGFNFAGTVDVASIDGVQQHGTGITYPYTGDAIDIRGVRQAITPTSGHSQVSGEALFAWKKTNQGRVSLSGKLARATGGSSGTAGVLPAWCKPEESVTLFTYGVDAGGVVIPVIVTIDAFTGNIAYGGNGSLVMISFNGLTFDVLPWKRANG